METLDQDLLEIINTIRAKSNQKAFDVLNDEMDLRKDLGFNSLSLAELTVRIESKFGVDIFEDGLIFSMKEIKDKLK